MTHATPDEAYFWGVHNQAELDLLIVQDGKRLGFEVKYTDAPRITPSMTIALNDLKLSHLYVVYPGRSTFPLSDRITAVGLENFLKNKF